MKGAQVVLREMIDQGEDERLFQRFKIVLLDDQAEIPAGSMGIVPVPVGLREKAAGRVAYLVGNAKSKKKYSQ